MPSKDQEQSSYTATLIGCGKMGGAMLRFWLEEGLLSHITVIDPTPLPAAFTDDKRIVHKRTTSAEDITSDILIIAVKPQILDMATQTIKDLQNTLVLSIAAGKTLASLENIFTEDALPIVRTMPNTPAAIGKGVCVSIANKHVSEAQKQCITNLLSALGTHQWIEDESLLNAVTALSGSGPAYIFHLIEVLSKAGNNIGLPEGLARTLARQTVIGSATLAEVDSDTPASVLRTNVTSPGGTTEAALNTLMDGRIQGLYNDALHAAKKRGEELE